MEKITPKEMQMYQEISAKMKRIERAKKKFLEEADAMKEELLARWGVSASDEAEKRDDLEIIADVYYGVDRATLRSYITSEQQVNYFKRMHYNERVE